MVVDFSVRADDPDLSHSLWSFLTMFFRSMERDGLEPLLLSRSQWDWLLGMWEKKPPVLVDGCGPTSSAAGLASQALVLMLPLRYFCTPGEQ